MSAFVGVGIDVVDIGRFEESISRTPGMIAKLFTDAEAALPLSSLAARFAAKEAIAKALGAPGGLEWHDAEVVRDASGQPRFVVRGTVAARLAELGGTDISLSLSHDAGIAAAIVIVS